MSTLTVSLIITGIQFFIFVVGFIVGYALRGRNDS